MGMYPRERKSRLGGKVTKSGENWKGSVHPRMEYEEEHYTRGGGRLGGLGASTPGEWGRRVCKGVPSGSN